MTKIERRRITVPLYSGNYEHDLADLMERAMAALRAEESGATPRRAGTKSEANKLALEYDKMAAEAEQTAVKVTVWAIGYEEWDAVADEHPPREGDAKDAMHGVNMKTFPRALLLASLVVPDTDGDGAATLAELDLSRVNYRKLETAAWNVNVGDDALPKSSLVSLLKQAREPDSKPPSDSE